MASTTNSVKQTFAIYLKGQLKDTLTHLNNVIKSDKDTPESVDNLHYVVQLEDHLVQHTSLANTYNQYLDDLIIHLPNNESQDPLELVNPLFKEYLSQYYQCIQAKEGYYLNRYYKFCQTDKGDKAEFDKLIPFTPSRAVVEYKKHHDKVFQDIANYEGTSGGRSGWRGWNYMKDGEEFANYLYVIFKASRSAISYIAACHLALERFSSGDVQGCQDLMEYFVDLPNIDELGNHGEGFDDGLDV
ncbi:hypothetical protein H4219_006130 [Mycoemilia scoparia]|uniref:Uncharacterized protein n=1 Tax=Mycoemilia scoparia TaxID=417184 RepID=A0A9W8DMW4_9FUNG|nr:hypothetical protein H4219_006130 [Mycoemilia scoparia]